MKSQRQARRVNITAFELGTQPNGAAEEGVWGLNLAPENMCSGRRVGMAELSVSLSRRTAQAEYR
jgi:hypothetical protein